MCFGIQTESGQITFEYLLITAAFFSFMLMLLGPLEKALDTAIFSVDALAAESFGRELNSASKSLSLLGEGSAKKAESKVLTNWHIFNDQSGLVIEISSEKLGITKKFNTGIHANFTEMHIAKKVSLTISKEKGGLMIYADADAPELQ